MTNLNQLQIATDGKPVPLKDHGVTSHDKKVSVFFRDLDKRLIDLILKSDFVVGCVAWMTHPGILEALSKIKGVSIVVQKEDWLRPDVNAKSGWEKELRLRYNMLPSKMTRYDSGFMGTTLHMMSCCTDPKIDPVRCVGNCNSERNPASPRSHHKFIVFCREIGCDRQSDSAYGGYFEPFAVWTGSFNFTKNAVMSFENAVVLSQPEVVRAYFHEYAQIAALSEPLNWNSEWAYPEWRVGT